MLHPAIGTVVLGRYALRREIARGGMGSVWLADDKRLRRQVAVKLLVPLWAQSGDVRARFEREAMAVAQLRSPHIVEIYDYGVEGECPFIVMELLEGEDLRTRLKRQHRLSLEDTARIINATSKALGEAHAAGIIHRDLKPDNLFLVRHRDEEVVKVLDFGVARARTLGEPEEDTTTKAGAILGTPQFMSPEQARGLPNIDHRSDLWALGVIAFRALTGQQPFNGASAGDIIVKICTQSAPRATTLAPDLPPEADKFFARALAHDPDKRFGSARELAIGFSRVAPVSFPSITMPGLPPPRPSAPEAPPPGQGLQELELGPADFLDDDFMDEAKTAAFVASEHGLTPSQPGLPEPPAAEPAQAPPAAVAASPGYTPYPSYTATPAPAEAAGDASQPSMPSIRSLEGQQLPPPADMFTGSDSLIDLPLAQPRRKAFVALVVGVTTVGLLAVAFTVLSRGSGPEPASASPAVTARTSAAGETAVAPAEPASAAPTETATAEPAASATTSEEPAAEPSAQPTAEPTAPPTPQDRPASLPKPAAKPVVEAKPTAEPPAEPPPPAPTAEPPPKPKRDLFGERF